MKEPSNLLSGHLFSLLQFDAILSQKQKVSSMNLWCFVASSACIIHWKFLSWHLCTENVQVCKASYVVLRQEMHLYQKPENNLQGSILRAMYSFKERAWNIFDICAMSHQANHVSYWYRHFKPWQLGVLLFGVGNVLNFFSFGKSQPKSNCLFLMFYSTSHSDRSST